ncbi:MAG: glycosyltransferase [Oscillospiraceae bacterium]|nr:glycosyltransferase [Oscillospiraceae bacterium]
MKRIVFFSIPAWGHTNPTVEVVRELVRRGNAVRYYTFAPFREKLEGAGAEVILCDGFLPPAPADLDERMGKDFSLLIKMVTDTTLAMDEKVMGELKLFRPHVIVSDSVCFWGKLFARKLGVPYVCSTTTFAFNQHTAKLMKPKAGEMLYSLLGFPRISRCMARLRRHGYKVEKFLDLIQNDNETDTIVYTSPRFQPMAETFSRRYAFVGPSLPHLPEEEASKSRPLIYISLGTVMFDQPDFFRRCVEGLAGLDADVILSTGREGDFSALPENMKAYPRVDQLEVLRRADLFVTHCGMNSANEAIWFGVPTVLYPQQSEETAVADRMEELGLGVRLKSDAPEAIRGAVETVLREPRYRENTRRLSQEFRCLGGAEAAADKIESMAEADETTAL